MKLEIYTIEDQARGNFNNGEILENKPIGFPSDGGKLKPYSIKSVSSKISSSLISFASFIFLARFTKDN